MVVQSENTWTEKKPKISPPGRMYPRMASVWGDDKVVLFGGSGSQLQNDTWVYDLSDNTWVERTPLNPTPNNNPYKRYWHGMASISTDDKVMLFGGKSGGTIFNDTWITNDIQAQMISCDCPDKTRYQGDAWKTSLRMRPEWAVRKNEN